MWKGMWHKPCKQFCDNDPLAEEMQLPEISCVIDHRQSGAGIGGLSQAQCLVHCTVRTQSD
jgi:hypothetical protein